MVEMSSVKTRQTGYSQYFQLSAGACGIGADASKLVMFQVTVNIGKQVKTKYLGN